MWGKLNRSRSALLGKTNESSFPVHTEDLSLSEKDTRCYCNQQWLNWMIYVVNLKHLNIY